MTARWTTACHWRLQIQQPLPLAVSAAQRIQPKHGCQSFPCLMLWRSWVWNGLPQGNCPVAAWMNVSCRGATRSLINELHHSSQRSTTRSPNLGVHPTRASSSSSHTSVDGAEEKGYDSLPSLDESVAMHLHPPTAIGCKAKVAHPSKP